jgi:hypothetical protein
MDIDFTPLERIRAAYEPLIKHLDFDEEEEKEKVPTNQERSGSRMPGRFGVCVKVKNKK